MDADTEDGATEVVDLHPERQAVSQADLQAVVSSPVSRLDSMRAAGADHRSNFILIRTARGAVKIAYAHFPILNEISSIWLMKRTANLDNCGATVKDIADAMQKEQNEVRNVVASLIRNQAVRSVVTHSGYQGKRATYYPTEFGRLAVTLAGVLGDGALVQVGHVRKAWAAKNLNEPGSIFEFAALYAKVEG